MFVVCCSLLVAFQRNRRTIPNTQFPNIEYILHLTTRWKVLNWYYDASGSGWWWQQNHSDSYKQVTYPISHYFLFKMLVALFCFFFFIFLLCLVFRSFLYEFVVAVLVVVFMFLYAYEAFFTFFLRFGVTSCRRICLSFRFSLQRSIFKLIKRNANFMNEI